MNVCVFAFMHACLRVIVDVSLLMYACVCVCVSLCACGYVRVFASCVYAYACD